MTAPMTPRYLRPAACSIALCALAWAPHTQAGRPLSVEDAGVNPFAQCQLETWIDQTADEHSLVLAPACGLGHGVEVGLEFDSPRRTSQKESGRSLAVKWVPEKAQWMGWSFGAKASISQVRAAGNSDWDDGPTSLLGIATYSFDPHWTAHLNLGADLVKNPSDTVATAGVAVVWTPHKNWLVFAEVSGSQDTAATRAAGARFWLMPDELGLDLTASRVNAQRDSTAYTLGVSWYGIKF